MKPQPRLPHIPVSGSTREEFLRARATGTVLGTVDAHLLAAVDAVIRSKVESIIEERVAAMFADRGVAPRENMSALGDVQNMMAAMFAGPALDNAIAALVDARLAELVGDLLPVAAGNGPPLAPASTPPSTTPTGADPRLRQPKFGGRTRPEKD